MTTGTTGMTSIGATAGGDGGALDRGGHLNELALDRYRHDPPEARFVAAVEAHLAACARCREALAALDAEDAAVTLAPPVTLAPVVPLAPRRALPKLRWVGPTLAVLAAAALALVVVRPWQGAPDDVLTLKGKAMDFEVHVHDGAKSRPAMSGDAVRPGERMGFRVHLRRAGWLAIFGRDDRGSTYPCYPRADAGGPTATALQAVAHAPTAEPETLPVAMRFDDILGDEHITAVFCEHPFALGADFTADAKALADAGCVVSEVTLTKVRGEDGPR